MFDLLNQMLAGRALNVCAVNGPDEAFDWLRHMELLDDYSPEVIPESSLTASERRQYRNATR